MGGPMSSRLLDAGYSLCVFDTNPDVVKPLAARGVEVVGSPAEVASIAQIVLMSLPTPTIVQQVALGEQGVVQGSKVKTLVDLSTTGPGVASTVGQGVAERGITLVDSPVSGGVAGAKAGTLAVMVSCPKPTLAQVEPILKNLGRLFYTGEKPGLAQTAKLANNLLAAAALVVSSEALAMGVKAGLDPNVLLDIINAGSGRNSATQDKFPRSILPGTFDFGFATGRGRMGGGRDQK
jgi:3-hydroxyisobutyrate dehydrogenase-like beta-hydroxyacid dehydrogenase